MVQEKNKKTLSPKLDVVFQALFGEIGNERITKAFLQEILKEKIDKIELNVNPILRRETIEDKMGVLDVIAKINNKQNIDIEMQMISNEKLPERILYYWARLFSKGIKKGEDYEKLEKTIAILITNEKIEKFEKLKYHTEWKIFEKENKKEMLTDKLEIHIIQLEKIEERSQESNDKLLDWLYFLINPNSRRVKEKMAENEELKEAKEKLDKITEDARMQQLAWWREKAIYEENTRINSSYKRGIRDTAKKMKEKNISIETIVEITGLTKEEIEKL